MARFDFENPIFQAEEEGDEDCELPEELTRLLKQEEKGYSTASRVCWSD